MDFNGGFKADTDMIAGYDQAHAYAQEALRESRGFFLIVLKGESDEIEAHVGANATIDEVEDMSITAANVAKTITDICASHRDSSEDAEE